MSSNNELTNTENDYDLVTKEVCSPEKITGVDRTQRLKVKDKLISIHKMYDEFGESLALLKEGHGLVRKREDGILDTRMMLGDGYLKMVQVKNLKISDLRENENEMKKQMKERGDRIHEFEQMLKEKDGIIEAFEHKIEERDGIIKAYEEKIRNCDEAAVVGENASRNLASRVMKLQEEISGFVNIKVDNVTNSPNSVPLLENGGKEGRRSPNTHIKDDVNAGNITATPTARGVELSFTSKDNKCGRNVAPSSQTNIKNGNNRVAYPVRATKRSRASDTYTIVEVINIDDE